MIVGWTWAREQVDDTPDVGCVKPVIGVEHGVRLGKDPDRDE
ncbi:MAG TPA: hypothetical protein VJY65_11625 [Chloroflexota bacterium]|nr:hypothetical protein [Chloroflexota bacterium]